jgi:hypothetical protein
MSPPPQNKLDIYFDTQILEAAKEETNKPEPKLSRQDKKEQKLFVDTIMYGLTAPIVFGSRQWASSFPEDLIERARMLRLAKSAEIMKEQMCTLLDCVAFFYPMSMDAPMRHEYVKMYMYCYKHGLPEKWDIMINSDPDLERMTDLHENEHEELRIIRRKIFNRQMNQVKNHN